MNRISRRIAGLSSCLLGASFLLVMPMAARAQLTLNMTTTASQPCKAVTDVQGIRSDPSGGSAMVASGVTLTGAGCGAPVTAPTPSPLNVFSAPTSGTTGTTFTVGWSVANADTCIGTATLDNGALSSLAGWTTTTATSGPRSVTLSTAGAYVLKLTCSNSAGSTTGSVPITVQNPGSAPTPSPIILTPSATTGSAGATFSINWSVAGATACVGAVTRDGTPLSTLSGWTTTTTTTGPRSVTLSTAGVYAFTLDCSNETGSTSGSTGISVQGVSNPPTPNPLTLTPSSTTGNVGDTFSINWTVSGASSCTGTVTRDGSALSSLSGWTTTTATAGPRSVTLNTAGTYAFALNCSNSAGSTSGSTSIVVSTSGSDQCGQQQTGQVFFQSGNSATIDITKFENILGKASSSTTAVPFPGINMSPWITNVDKNSFIAAKFVVPATISTSKTGTVALGDNGLTYHTVDISMSPTCGFAQNPPDSKCLLLGLGSNQGMNWKIQGSTGSGVACTLVPGQTYFLNVRFNPPPTETTAPCTTSACQIPFVNTVSN